VGITIRGVKVEAGLCGGPPYYYKVAYEEAERMLEKMKAEG
jgi:hypothetical protein